MLKFFFVKTFYYISTIIITYKMFEFRGLYFNGFKFKRSNLYSEEFFEKLINEGSHYSEIKYIDAVEEQIDENIHIKLSYSVVFKVLSLSGLLFIIILGINFLFIPAYIILGISFISQILFNLFKKRANEFFIGKKMSKDLINLIFNQ